MNETIILPESIIAVGLCLMVLVAIFAGLFGYFKGVADECKRRRI